VIVFVDTSALGSAYLGDEADGQWIADVIIDGEDPVVVSQLADIEFAGLLVRARADRRLDAAGLRERLDAYAGHTADSGPIGVVPLTGDTISRARQLVLRAPDQHPVRTLDALQLASADLVSESSNEDVVLLTVDRQQARAAENLGFALHRR
jgi:predicted nucleic acid-binding protein